MSVVTGPISSLPGSRHAAPDGAKCDEHAERDAVARIQGETDSFGAELIDCCTECVEQIRAARDADRSGRCDWCHSEATDLRPARDYDEGMTGPVYRVCGACTSKANEEARAELERYDAELDDYDAAL